MREELYAVVASILESIAIVVLFLVFGVGPRSGVEQQSEEPPFDVPDIK